ncbi:small ubiquitin-related modifier domain-containing protein [Aliifodinibius sp. S!AR15-10]|uniref:EsaB/YukD family protein n=1 Tax=Aliifodinibius sp. S!AR15-10 TaxID=2950437 RepID=UPI00285D5F08|nr:EsaB/YukD family protein [Aliifodinibius sp. S!AR15-10]MDR8389937.1 small ubiquitin-related modifier domain-containing protein [Aliifodinibius sp. S!AR15-10]
MGSKQDKSKSDKALTLTVITTRGEYEDTFPKTTKVQEVIDKIRDHFDLTGTGTFELIIEGSEEELNPNRPLVSYGLEDGDELILTNDGKNV